MTPPPSTSNSLEGWIADDIGLIDDELLILGRQVQTDHGGFIDLLCMNAPGDLVVVELKRDKHAARHYGPGH